jgi:hypothetical protein
MFRVLTTAFVRFVRFAGNLAECQKIDKMPGIPACGRACQGQILFGPKTMTKDQDLVMEGDMIYYFLVVCCLPNSINWPIELSLLI